MNYYLESERIGLRPLEKDDLPALLKLMTNRKLGELTGEIFPLTEKELYEFYERCQKTDNRVWFLIIDKESQNIIGETGLLRISYPWRTSDFSLIIFDQNYWGNGYGKEASQLMLDYAFHSLNLNRLGIGVVGFNERALKFWKSIGFVEEGIQREGYFCRGEFSDFIMMSLLYKDYKNAQKEFINDK